MWYKHHTHSHIHTERRAHTQTHTHRIYNMVRIHVCDSSIYYIYNSTISCMLKGALFLGIQKKSFTEYENTQKNSSLSPLYYDKVLCVVWEKDFRELMDFTLLVVCVCISSSIFQVCHNQKLNKYCTIKTVLLHFWVFCICRKTHYSWRYGMYQTS